MSDMICEVCFKPFSGSGTYCADCSASEELQIRRRIDAIHSRIPDASGASVEALPYAPRRDRILAGAIDFLFELSLVTALSFLLSSLFLPSDGFLLQRVAEQGVWELSPLAMKRFVFLASTSYVMFLLVSLSSFIAFESSPLQGSIGKMLLGLKVVCRRGERPSFSRIVVRNLSRLVLVLPVVSAYFGNWLWLQMNQAPYEMQQLHNQVGLLFVVSTGFVLIGIEALPLLFNRKRQAIHDVLSDTFVVRIGSIREGEPRQIAETPEGSEARMQSKE